MSASSRRRSAWVRWLGVAALVACIAWPAAAQIQWKTRARAEGSAAAAADSANTLQRMSPVQLQAAFSRVAEGERDARRVVVFDAPLSQADRQALEDSGIRLLNYLGNHGYFATVRGDVDAVRAAQIGSLQQVFPIETSHKLHPDLEAGVVHPWQIVHTRYPEEAGKGKTPPAEDPIVAVNVLFHRDVELEANARTIVGAHGGKVRSLIRSIQGANVHLPASAVRALAADDAVMFVEPPLPILSELNDSARARVEADTLQQAPYDLDGSGVTVLVYDAGQMFQHGDFAGRLTVGASDTSGISDHATHVGGTIGGDGAGSGGTNRGMAPAVDLVSFGFEQEGGLQQGFLYTDPGDIEVDYTDAISTYGADLSNNSIGTNTAPNGYPCEWEGDYGATGALIDAIVGGSLGDPFRIVWANGNERGSGRCGTTYLTTAPPACAKNHITVGALNSNDDSVTSFTSWGPTDDGRIKPDISGPGCQSDGDGGLTSTSSSGGYNVKCGTSMASPATAGVAALMLQQYRQSFPGLPDPRNSTIKAILANTATDIGNVGPDYQSGYGSIRGVAAVDTVAEERFIEAAVAQGETYAFIVVVDPADTELKVTIAWDDPPGTPNVNPVLVNDLDLRVVDSGGGIHLPWTLDPANPDNPAVRTVRDGANNIEQVTIDNPAPGAYRVEVTGFNIADGPTQVFSATASPTLINCSSAGVISTSGSRIACEATLSVAVIDCDLNADDGAMETTTVSIVSDSEPAGETLLLTENAPESAAFENTIPVSVTDAPGVLAVADGDTITATYIDADDGEGGTNLPRTRNLTVDCTAPVVQSVTIDEVKARVATVSIEADEPVGATVRYGTSCAALDSTAVKGGLLTTQTLDLTGLEPNTDYFFDLTVTDEAGNATPDDNQGNCYSFTTPDIPDFLTQQFTAGSDLTNTTISFVPDGSIDFYTYCAEPNAGSFPHDPTAGTSLGLGDDPSASITLSGGATVSLYGQSYSEVFVGPNGYLTFGAGDSTYNETLASHFSLPRVAGMFDDLNPSAGGDVTWIQLADRLVVSWDGVAEYSTTNSNSFQIEMLFSGEIRIHWLTFDSQDHIVGLSDGSGLSPDFFPSDFSDEGVCGPRPPQATSYSLQTDVNTPLAVTPSGTDDGLPGPGGLIYRIVSLPAAGSLVDDATGAPIVVTPRTVAGSVTYTPALDFQGGDGFSYVADDGGIAPEGGSSAPATVTITVGGPSVVHEFLVDDTDPGWTGTGGWAFGTPTGGGSHNGDPSAGFTGANVLGYELGGDYGNNMSEEMLTSAPMDLSGALQTTVEYQRWLGVESSQYDHATFQVSADGTNWTTIWDHSGGSVDESNWSLHSYDISSVADGQSAVQLRWIMGTTDGSVTYPGWNLDDIRVLSTSSSTGPDCDPGDPDVWRVPGELLNLRVDLAGGTSVSWNDQSVLAGPGTAYELTSGGMGAAGIDMSGPVCLQSGSGSSHVDLQPDPAPGTGYWYLGRAWNSCGGSTFGNGGRDASMPDGNGDYATDLCE